MKRLLSITLFFFAISAYAATPNQYGVNTVVPGSIDDTTGAATAPFVNHATGGLNVNIVGSTSASGVPVQISGAPTNASGTITSGGVAQTIIAAATKRNHLFILNPATATETLYISYVGTASASSITLAPGQAYQQDDVFVPNSAISVFAGTTGHAFIADYF